MLIVIAVLFMFWGCEKDQGLDDFQVHYFKVGYQFDLPDNNVAVDDTVWVKSTIEGNLIDTVTNEKVFFTDAYLMINMIIRDWESNDTLSQNDNYSILLNTPSKYASYTKNAALLGLEYNKEKDVYLLNIGVVFHSPGIYSIDFDYLEVVNPDNQQAEYFGGGIIQFVDSDLVYNEGYLIGEVDEENRNLDLYNGLLPESKSKFQKVNQDNNDKYFFINIEEDKNE